MSEAPQQTNSVNSNNQQDRINSSLSYDLAELILDTNLVWKVHNCKLLNQHCSKEGELPFIYHYDKLSDSYKQSIPLDAKLLPFFNKPMTCQQAADLLKIDISELVNPWFVKLLGSIVIYNDVLQLAIKLHWTNTAKQCDAIYCTEHTQALKTALDRWQFIGRVDTLYKQHSPQLSIYNEAGSDTANLAYTIPTTNHYQNVEKDFSVALCQHLNDNLHDLSWVYQAIQQRLL